MSQTATHLSPPIAKSLDTWHALVARGDLSGLEAIVHPDAVFRSPMAHNPYGPRQALLLILGTVITIFKEFTYHRQFTSSDGMSVVLEFSAVVGDKKVSGIDMIRFNEEGLIMEFEVMVRPMSGLQVLGAEMGARLAQHLGAFKGKE
jgi:hypothetical protein